MPYPTAEALRAAGMTVELANYVGGTDPFGEATVARAVSKLCNLGMPAEQVNLLAGVAYSSRPKDKDLIGLHMVPQLAAILGQP